MSDAMKYCFWCGEDLGFVRAYPGDRLTCGADKCEREARADERAERENAMLDAAEDDYQRYR